MFRLRPADGSDADEMSDLTALSCSDRSLAKQEFKEECDINTIIDRFGVGYAVPENVRVPMLGEFEGISDFQDAMNLTIEARDGFMQMSASTRARFNNDPGSFVNYCSERDAAGKLVHLDEMRKLGLALPAPVVVPERVMKVEVVEPSSVAPKAS